MATAAVTAISLIKHHEKIRDSVPTLAVRQHIGIGSCKIEDPPCHGNVLLRIANE
jgi:hypothetical protein